MFKKIVFILLSFIIFTGNTYDNELYNKVKKLRSNNIQLKNEVEYLKFICEK